MSSEPTPKIDSKSCAGKVEIIVNDLSSSGEEEDLITDMMPMMPITNTIEGETIFALPKDEIEPNEEEVEPNKEEVASNKEDTKVNINRC